MQRVFHSNQLCVFRRNKTDIRQRSLDRLLIGRKVNRDHADSRTARRYAINASRVVIHFVQDFLRCIVCHSDSGSVPVRLLCETQDDNLFDLRRVAFGGSVLVLLSSDHIRVHAGTTDILADLIND